MGKWKSLFSRGVKVEETSSRLRIIPLQAQAHHVQHRREDERGRSERVLRSPATATGTSKQAHTYLCLSVGAKASESQRHWAQETGSTTLPGLTPAHGQRWEAADCGLGGSDSQAGSLLGKLREDSVSSAGRESCPECAVAAMRRRARSGSPPQAPSPPHPNKIVLLKRLL